MKNVLVLLAVSSIVILLAFALFPFSFTPSESSLSYQRSRNNSSARSQELTAFFQVYIHGLPVSFTDSSFFQQSPSIYLLADSPHVIRFQEPSMSWMEFFETLPISLSSSCYISENNQDFCTIGDMKLYIFINGQPAAAELNQPIQPEDRLLITYGNLTEVEINYQLSQLANLKP
jgi:hypothetical protein